MSELTLVRTPFQPTPEQVEVFRAVLLGMVDGWDATNQKRWKRFWKMLIAGEAGELFEVIFKRPRNPRFHRKFFAMLSVGFDAWDPAGLRTKHRWKSAPIVKDFDHFRKEVTILAGFYQQTYSLSGQMTVDARSINFASMDDDEFEKLYSAVVDVLLQKVLTHYTRIDLDDVVDKLMGFA